MKTRLLKTALCVSALFAAALLAAPVHADGVLDVTLTANNPVVTEGDSGFLDITVANNSSVGVIVGGLGLAFEPTAGDPSDEIDYFNFNFDTSKSTCGFFQTSLGAGSSCSFVFDFDTGSAAGETDADSGVTPAIADVNYGIGVEFGNTASTPFTFTVNDPGVATTPEPSSLLLLGSGLLGVLGFGRRRLI